MTEHSTGPWLVGYASLDVLAPGKDGHNFKVCDIRGWGYLTGGGHGALGLPPADAQAIQEANARLIAAAPELLAALKGALEQCVARHDAEGSTQSEMMEIEQARHAIRKVEGQS